MLGPTLWNALYNRVVALVIPDCLIHAFADDLMLQITGRSVVAVQETIAVAVEIVTSTIKSFGA